MLRLHCKPINEAIELELAAEANRLKAQGVHPSLAVILVGDDPASHIYVDNKKKACERLGIRSIEHRLPHDCPQEQLLKVVRELNQDPEIHGILCQVPLPKQCNEDEVIRTIDPNKDVDCFHPYNFGLLAQGQPRFMPCTPFGVLQILKRSHFPTQGKKVVVLGRSNIFGRPFSILMSSKPWDATVTLCHSRSLNLAAECRLADILVAAIGKPLFVTKDFVKPGAVVIDVGINRIEDPQHPKGSRVVGDVDYESLEGIAQAATPVPGGVGLMTVAMLMYNTLNAARFSLGLPPFPL